MTASLPVEAIKEEVVNAWHKGGCIVSAPPGSGKTTQLPLWLLEKNQKTIYLLIPKRIAVKMAAARLANNLNDPLGNRVGYRLRREQKTSKNTQLIVTTYGSFLRLLLNDPDSIGESTIIFDEFHERSAEQDFTFALINQYLDIFDDSIKRIIMSATMALGKIESQTGLPVIESEGFSHPLTIDYAKTDLNRFENIAPKILQLWKDNQDHVLVFLPGLREMRSVERALPNNTPRILLHSQLEETPNIAQLNNAPPTIILATNIAESSLTIPRVKTVVDCGFERYVASNPITGIGELKTRRISRSSATQRSGRAARLGPGYALRLWSEDEQSHLVAHQPAEISQAELTELYLLSLSWGCNLIDLPWLEAPPIRRVQAAEEKLKNWGAIDQQATLTSHGQHMIDTGLSPWLGHIVSVAQTHNCLTAGIILAAHCSLNIDINYDPFSTSSLISFNSTVTDESKKIAKRLSHSLTNTFEPFSERALIRALSDRLVYQANAEQGQLISGTSVVNNTGNSAANWVLLLDGIRSKNKILMSQCIAVSEDSVFAELPPLQVVEFLVNGTQNSFRLTKKLGKIHLSAQSHAPTQTEKIQAWTDYILATGEQAFNWAESTLQFKQKWLVAGHVFSDWPTWPTSQEWVKLCEPFLHALQKLNQLSLQEVLNHALGYERCKQLNQKLPNTWLAPSKRELKLTYSADYLSISTQCKLQELFGLECLPTFLEGIPLSVELTAPNGRPIAKVTDLSHFWHNVYPEVRKELRGRYSKHPWPEDPQTSLATHKTNRQLRNELERKLKP